MEEEEEENFISHLKLEQKSYNDLLELKRQDMYSREPVIEMPVRHYSIRKDPKIKYESWYKPVDLDSAYNYIGLSTALNPVEVLTRGQLNSIKLGGRHTFELEQLAQSSFVTTLEQRRIGLLTCIQSYRDTRYNQHLLNSLLSLITPEPVILPDYRSEENRNTEVLGLYDIILHTDAFEKLCNTPSAIREYPERDLILEYEVNKYEESSKILDCLSAVRSGNLDFVVKDFPYVLDTEKAVVKLARELKYATVMLGFRATHVQIGPQYKGQLLARQPTTRGIYLSEPFVYDLFQHPDIIATKDTILKDALFRVKGLDRSAEDTSNMSFFVPLSRVHQEFRHTSTLGEKFHKLSLNKGHEASDFCTFLTNYNRENTLQLINRFLNQGTTRVTSASIVDLSF